jgi:hypothetical protein
VENASDHIHQFPVRQGPSVWGSDLTAVSRPSDMAWFAVYGAALLLLYYLAVARVARRNARRATLRPLAAGR